VTRAENCRRGDHNQRRKTHCPKGHPYSGENLIIRTRRGSLSGRGCRECRRAQNRTRHRATELWALRRKAARLAHREQRRSGMTPTSGPIVKALLAAEAEAGA
jgi:hypothetical protein